MKVFTIVLNYNGALDTIECVRSLLSADTHSFDHRIIIVDNNSEISDLNLLYDNCSKETKIIVSDTNKGYAGGNNIGIRLALAEDADYIFILNNDTIIAENTLVLLLKFALDNPHAGIICPMHYYYDTDKIINYAGGEIDWWSFKHGALGTNSVDEGQYGLEPYTTGFASGAAMFLSSTTINDVGLLDEDLFLLYEDLDWSVRMQKHNLLIYVHPLAIIWHKESRSFGFKRGKISRLRAYYSARNQIIFRKRYSTASQWIVYSISLWTYRVPLHNLFWIYTSRSIEPTLGFFKGLRDGYKDIRKTNVKSK